MRMTVSMPRQTCIHLLHVLNVFTVLLIVSECSVWCGSIKRPVLMAVWPKNLPLSLTTAQVGIPSRAWEKVASDSGWSSGLHCVLKFPPPLTTGKSGRSCNIAEKVTILKVIQLHGCSTVTTANGTDSLKKGGKSPGLDAALLFLSVIPWGEICAYCHQPAQPLAAAMFFNWVAEITSCPLPLC